MMYRRLERHCIAELTDRELHYRKRETQNAVRSACFRLQGIFGELEHADVFVRHISNYRNSGYIALFPNSVAFTIGCAFVEDSPVPRKPECVFTVALEFWPGEIEQHLIIPSCNGRP